LGIVNMWRLSFCWTTEKKKLDSYVNLIVDMEDYNNSEILIYQTADGVNSCKCIMCEA
jgi:hypothetical protein